MAPSVSPTLAVALVATLVLWLPGGAAAQDPGDALAPPHLSIVEGSVRLERGGEVVQAEVGHILAVGDRLRSDRGRYEVVFGDGSALHVDERTTLDLLDDWLIRLLDGRVFLHVATPPDDLPLIVYRIDTPSATVRATMPGEYQVSSGGRPEVTDVAVARGLAEVIGSRGSVALHAGERVQARNGQPGAISVYNAAAWDAFDRWSYDRRLAWTDGAHAAYLPRHLTPYSSTLARHGTWSHHPTYGTVWYPHVVADWRPFYHGRWTVLSPYGWTWVGVDPWAWPTHYYGTWSVVSGRWFWIPGRAWSPARVHWVVSSGYVGWLPFGPVGVVHHIGWTIVPRHVFHINVIVPRHAVSVYSLRADVRRTFVAQRPPEPRGVAVPRASVISASRAPVRTAVARGGDAITPGQTPTASTATATARRTPTATLRDGTSASDGSRTAVRAGEPDRATATGSSAIRRLPPGEVGVPGVSSDAAGRTGTRTGTAVTRVPPATAAAPTTAGAPGQTARTAASRAPDAAAVSGGTSATATGGAVAFPRTAPSTPGTASRAPAATPSAPAASSPQAPAPARAVPRSAPAGEPAAPAASPAPAERAPASGGVRAVPRSSSSGASTTAPARATSAAIARVPAGSAPVSAPSSAAPRTGAPARVTPGATAPAPRPAAAAPVQRVAPAAASRPAGTAATPARPSAPAVSRSPAAAPSRPAAAAPAPARSAAPVSRAPAASSAPRTTASAPARSAPAAPAASPSAAGGRRAPAASSGGSGGGARQR